MARVWCNSHFPRLRFPAWGMSPCFSHSALPCFYVHRCFHFSHRQLAPRKEPARCVSLLLPLTPKQGSAGAAGGEIVGGRRLGGLAWGQFRPLHGHVIGLKVLGGSWRHGQPRCNVAARGLSKRCCSPPPGYGPLLAFCFSSIGWGGNLPHQSSLEAGNAPARERGTSHQSAPEELVKPRVRRMSCWPFLLCCRTG